MKLGHKNPKMSGGETLVEWITPTVKDECRFYNVPMPSDKQMAVVISALRMHTIIMHAAEYDKSNLHKPDEIDPYWPMQGSIGMFFRDAARITLDGAELQSQQESKSGSKMGELDKILDESVISKRKKAVEAYTNSKIVEALESLRSEPMLTANGIVSEGNTLDKVIDAAINKLTPQKER